MSDTQTHPQTVLVTGASSGIGKAIATALHEAGFRVFGTSRSPDKHRDLPFEMLALDVQDDDSVAACLEDLMARTGRLDVLVNNAGFGLYGAVEETSMDEAKAQMETNFFGVVRTVRAALPIMREQQRGKIINISSLAGLVGVPHHAFYAASKFAVEGFTESLVLELEPFNISVTLVEVGYVDTPFADHISRPEEPLAVYDQDRETVIESAVASIRKGHDPAKLGRAVVEVARADKPGLRKRVGADMVFISTLKRVAPYSVFKLGLRRNYGL
ncbi:MAG: SDR family NAD(P)-dependent oxidoreductase [Trueperaceae bacterium]|nr:SDR family NAD(P)-dependent oxidoreductase [Trueperaceae bacterium]